MMPAKKMASKNNMAMAIERRTVIIHQEESHQD
jgi:hypothetical protein